MANNARDKSSASLALDRALVDEARGLEIDVSRAAEWGIARAIAGAKTVQWKAENKKALASSNEFVEAHGLPLAGKAKTKGR
ncbi:post-segregation antitoxin CcdA [Variibacter gotjawalensis]|uniref:Post-segregation antitoxin CcdA n=1 Tax=Variibacter gotjawalensis TaxID=1333996 RepID=A0A0S3PVR5_9BRAD|nr:type II toxin-antitoxin system CcdA family antitoxin [Variibacter gotjawalensis]NIK45864.1 antitoxin CcdA [Variibacter gotjawalensis]RZS47787.1 antitoxin CcdA [Variibacter gotjawalensis]BAT60041.1 post-segregation antitoxin CcdA [Variibacter gotjawalensis]